MKITIDRKNCLGEAVCTAVAPGYFRMADDGKAEIIRENGEEKDVRDLMDAKTLCPAAVIKIDHM